MSHLRPGEQLVGAYHSVITGCELVSYNQRSREQGHQIEIDVLGVKSDNNKQTVYTCEVITHLDGALYSGTPSTSDWSEFGNKGYQYSLERIWEKFERDNEYVREIFDDAESYRLQLWSPKISEGYLTEGLQELKRRFQESHDADVELIINTEYTRRMTELREFATTTTKDYGQPAFRYLQILENLRE